MGLIMWDLQMVPAHTDECGRTEQTQLSDIDIDASLDMIGHMRSSLDILSRRVNDMRAPHSLTAEEYASLLNIRFNDAPEIRRNMSSAGQNRRNTGASSDRRDEYSHRDTHEDGVERRTGNTASSDRQVSISEYDHDSSVRISPTYPRTTDNDGPPELMSDSSQDSSSSDGMPALISFATPDMLARWMAMGVGSDTQSHTRQYPRSHTTRSHAARSHAARSYALRRRRDNGMYSPHAHDNGTSAPPARTVNRDLHYPISSRTPTNNATDLSVGTFNAMGERIINTGSNRVDTIEFGRISPEFNWVLPGQEFGSSQGSMDDIFDSDSGHIFADMTQFYLDRTSAQVGSADGAMSRTYSRDRGD